MKKKLNLFIMSFLVISLSLFINCTPAQASTELVYGDGTITRAEWLHDLVVTFNMTVEDENYPDNYFSDLQDTSEYYQDVLLAVQFGLVDCVAGDAVDPDGLVTRDFAAHTLNKCLGFQLKEGEIPSFADKDLSSYPVDAHIAIVRKWFEPIDGNFSPNANITSDEVKIMLDDAAAVLAEAAVDKNHQNTYAIADGVVEVPVGTKVEKTDENTITITDCPVTIKQGDKFVVYFDELANAYTADEIAVDGDVTTIKTSVIEDGSAFKDINAEGIVDADLTQIEAVDGTEIIYMNESTGQEYTNARVAQREIIPIDRTIKATRVLNLGNGVKAEVTLKINNPKIEYKVNAGLTLNAYAKLTGNTEIIYKIKFEAHESDAAVGLDDIRFINCIVPGVGGFSVALDIEATGSVGGVTSGYLTAGLSYSTWERFRIIKGFNAKSFTLNVEADVACGLEAKFGITDIPGDVFSGYVYAKAGGKASVKGKIFSEGTPNRCSHYAAYLYAEYGAKGTVKKFGIIEDSISLEYTLYDEKNSPIRVIHHYEDGKLVRSCTRGIIWDNRYYTKGDSRYAGSGWINGENSRGLDGNGAPIIIYDYKLDENQNATITKYQGNARALVIPETIDGYKVVAIGREAFKGNAALTSVIIPDSVTEIESMAFSECSNLAEVMLPENLKIMRSGAFKRCNALTSIKIPKSLDIAGAGAPDTGAFGECTSLKTVIFEEGITEIPEYLFKHCTGLEEITIPDTVVTIEQFAFSGCDNLKKIKIGNSVTTIEREAFSYNESVEEVIIPDSVTAMGYNVFLDCKLLKNVTLSKNLKTMESGVFGNCIALESIKIPKSLDSAGSGHQAQGAFGGCAGLKTVEFEEGITEIPEFLFKDCTGLEEITIPDTVTSVELYAFAGCTNLKTVTMPDTVNQIGESIFRGCTNLTSVTLSKSLEDITYNMFRQCTSLESIVLPDKINRIMSDAFSESGLKQIVIPEGVETIQNDAFRASALESVEINNSTVTIGNNAWKDCAMLSKVSLGNNVKSVGDYAFYNCDQLSEIVIPDSVTRIGSNIFANNMILNKVTLGTGLTEIPSYAFYECPALEKMVLPYRIKTIQANAFTNCTAFNSLTIPRATTTIADTILSYPDKVTIYGVAKTYAETYATAHNIKFVNQEVKATEATLNHTELTLDNGKSETLVLSVTPSDFTDAVSWVSDNEQVATITDAGVVTAKGRGIATIKVYVGDVSASCKVTVVQPVTSISLDKTSLEMNALDTYTLTARVSPDNAENKQVTWESSDEKIATVDQNGLVTALAKGTATITATAAGGTNISKSCTVTVKNNAYIASTVDEMESPHNYTNNCSDFWLYTLKDAANLKVTFNEKTNIEEGFDYLYVYTGDGTEVGKYTGTELAGKSIHVKGDTVRIQLVTNPGGTEWGFKVDSITASDVSHEHSYVNPTFVWTGETAIARFTCTDCGEKLDGTAVVSKETPIPATCTQPGKNVYTAKVSLNGKEYSNVKETSIPATGHSGGTATCTQKAVCTKCGSEYGTVTGHTGGTATCYEKAVCTKCHQTYGSLNASNHVGGTGIRNDKKATCTQPGYTGDTYCKGCGKTISSGRAIAITAHRYGAWVVTKTATYTEDGREQHSCTVCGTPETRIIPKLARINISNAAVSGIGNKRYTGKAQIQSSLAVQLGNTILRPGIDYAVSYVNNTNIGTATVMITGTGAYTGTINKNFKILATRGTTYTIKGMRYKVASVYSNGTGTVMLTGSTLKSRMTSLKVGNTVTIGGKAFKITAIGNKAFYGYKKLSKVSIGNYVQTIDTQAFAGCTKLSSVSVGSELVKIGSKAFYGDKTLKAITIKSKKLKSIGSKSIYKIYKKAVIRVPSSKLKTYKKLFKSSTGFKSSMKLKK